MEARSEITKVDLGCHFHALVAAWTCVEAASRWENSGTNLSSKGRPKQVGNWIATGRGKRGTPPRVADPVAFAQEWANWWDSLQPEWRVKRKDGTWSTDGGYGKDGKDWGPLYQWGVNGTLSILAALYFWGCRIVDDKSAERKEVWEAAVNDVVWILEGMTIYYEMFNKRF